MIQTKRKILGAGLMLVISLGILIFRPNASAATKQSINEFPTSGQPGRITAGADGNLWFTEPAAIGRITTAGVVTEFPLPVGSSDPHAITAGPDGNVWFTLPNQNAVGRITPSGIITEITGIAAPMGITTGPDGNLWITQASIQISQITTTGVITTFPVGIESCPDFITTGADGNLWYIITIAYRGGNQIGRITPTGTYTEFNMLTWVSGVYDLVSGNDGNIWFTEMWKGKIGRITPAGVITEFVLPNDWYGSACTPVAITNGPDDYLWFTSDCGIGRMSLSGDVSFFSGFGTNGIATGSDGNLWFTDYWGQQIGRLTIHRSFLPLVAK